jgi:O-antigen/teichoic acid export membrane protein
MVSHMSLRGFAERSDGGSGDGVLTRASAIAPGPSETGVDSLRTLASGTLLTLFGLVSNGVLTFVLVLMVSRGLGPQGAGVFFQIVALFTILTTVAELGAAPGMVRMVARYRALARVVDILRTLPAALWPVGGVSILLAFGLFALAPGIAEIVGLPADAGDHLRLLSVFLPLSAISGVALAATRGLGTMKAYVLTENIGKPLLRTMFVAGALVAGGGALAVILAWALPIAIAFPVALLTMVRLIKRVAALDLQATEPVGSVRRLASEFWRFAAPRGLATIFQVTTLWLDLLLVGVLRSSGEAGIYGAVGRLAMFGVFAVEAMRLAIAPHISGLLAKNDRQTAQSLYRVGTWWLMALSWPFYLTLAVFAPVILGALFGPQFGAGRDALLIISLAMLVGVSTGNVSVVLLMAGKSIWNLANTVLGLIVNVMLNLVLIPRYGIVGAAAAWAITIGFNNLVPLTQVGLLLGLNPFGRGFGLVALFAVLCYGLGGIAVRLTVPMTLGNLIIFGFVASALYALLLLRFGETLHLSVIRELLRRWGSGNRTSRSASAEEIGT